MGLEGNEAWVFILRSFDHGDRSRPPRTIVTNPKDRGAWSCACAQILSLNLCSAVPPLPVRSICSREATSSSSRID